MSKKESVDVVISFDTTGSIYPALTQIRREVEATTKTLFDEVPGLRVGIFTHGDYCDAPNTFNFLDLTDNRNRVIEFINNAPKTGGGGNNGEAYELMFNKVREMSWTGGKNKCLVFIGDEQPHEVGYKDYGNSQPNKLDWENELQVLIDMGIQVYPVRALNHTQYHAGRNQSTAWFYDKAAKMAGVEKLNLSQFNDVTDLIMAVFMNRAGKLEEFEKQLDTRKVRVSFETRRNIDILAGRKISVKWNKKSEHNLHAVDPSRFQILRVDEDTPIKKFVEDNGLTFKTGRGFYEFTKTVEVQEYKEVIIQDKNTDEMFSGDKAREILGIPVGKRAKVRPEKMNQYRGFIQSTSNNRKLLGGTGFLYEVENV